MFDATLAFRILMGFVVDWPRWKVVDVSLAADLNDHLSCLANYLYAAQRDLEQSGSADHALAAIKAANACTLEVIDLTSKLGLLGHDHHGP
ncbi:MAG: hypothetical protein ACTHLT_03505 [Devosia sp.]